jgi:hypothetical protein
MMNDDLARIERIGERLKRLGAETLLTRVAERYGILGVDILGRGRQPVLAAARREFWALLKGTTGRATKELGALLELHHTTIVCGLQVREAQVCAELGIPVAPIYPRGHAPKPLDTHVERHLRLVAPKRVLEAAR